MRFLLAYAATRREVWINAEDAQAAKAQAVAASTRARASVLLYTEGLVYLGMGRFKPGTGGMGWYFWDNPKLQQASATPEKTS